MFVHYKILNFDDVVIADVIADASVDVAAYGALTGIDEMGKTSAAFIEALTGEIVAWEEGDDRYIAEIPHGNGWISGPGIQRAFAYRWTDGYELHG